MSTPRGNAEHTSGAADDNQPTEHYGEQVMDGMRHLWQQNLLCDVQLRVGSRVFPAHRNILASLSSYFRVMFTSGFSESAQSEVELRDVSVSGMTVLLDYVYGGTATVDADNLEDVLHAASLLQFQQVQELCATYMDEKVEVENCITFLRLADRYNLTTCFDRIVSYALDHFVTASQHAGFTLISADVLAKLLDDNRLITDSELQVFRAACRWLTTNKSTLAEKTEEIAYRLLSLIRYELLTNKEMTEVYREPVIRSSTCWPLLQAALDFHLNPASERQLVRMRRLGASLRILSADDVCEKTIASMLDITDRDGNMQFTACDERAYSHVGACVAVINDVIYVVGGFMSQSGEPTAKMSSYNSRDGQWQELSPMSVPRREFVLVSHPAHYLVAIGGSSRSVRGSLSTCERYDFATNDWRSFPSLQNAINSHSGCVLSVGDADAVMYISGGWNGGPTNVLLSCKNGDSAWHEKAPMLSARYGHVMVSHGSRLIVCAGSTSGGRNCLTVEMYDTRCDNWTVVETSTEPQGQWGPSAVVRKSNLYILGGWQNNKGRVDTVQCYDLQHNDWRRTDLCLPQAMGNVVAYCT